MIALDHFPLIRQLQSNNFPPIVDSAQEPIATVQSAKQIAITQRNIRSAIAKNKDSFHFSPHEETYMKLFETIPGDLFSVLASPNRFLYADALDVLYEAYRDHLKIPEDMLYSMLRSRLERELADASFEGEDIDEEELRDISGRARFLIRKLCSKGWFEKERGENFEEYITVPSYSSRLLELFHQLADDTPARGYSYVYNTYSSLKVAHEGKDVFEKMVSVYSAYDNTQSLIKLLQMVYHNVKHYFQMQVEMQDINQILSAHFDDFGQKVIEAYIRPLKIKDSVPKYRVSIQKILDEWLDDDKLLTAMAQSAFQDKRAPSANECRDDLLRKVFWIKEQFDSIEHDYLDEIDRQVRRYTRATTQKIENLTNRDQNTRGNLNYLLNALSRNKRSGALVEQIQTCFQLYEQSFLSERSLWYRKHPGRRDRLAPVLLQDEAPDKGAWEEAEELFRAKYGKAAVKAYMEAFLSGQDTCYTSGIALADDHDYIMSLLSVMGSDDTDAFYSAEDMPGSYSSGRYTIPQIRFERRRKTNEP